jgi:hypothetical protein
MAPGACSPSTSEPSGFPADRRHRIRDSRLPEDETRIRRDSTSRRLAHFRGDDAGRGLEAQRANARLAARRVDRSHALPENVRQHLRGGGRNGEAPAEQQRRPRDHLGVVAGRRQAGHGGDEPGRDARFLRGSFRTRHGSQGQPGGARTFSRALEVHAHRRRREGDRDRSDARRKDGSREGTRHLRVDRREYVPGPQDTRLRRR